MANSTRKQSVHNTDTNDGAVYWSSPPEIIKVPAGKHTLTIHVQWTKGRLTTKTTIKRRSKIYNTFRALFRRKPRDKG